MVSFERTVSGLCESILRARCVSDPGEVEPRHPAVVRFVLDQQARMPDYLRLPFRILTLLFDGLGLLSSGRPFHDQPHAVRVRQIESWRRSPLSFCRDFVRFYESLIVYHWYSE